MKSFLNNKKERTRFLKFVAVGVIGAIVDFGIMNLLTQKAGISLVWAGTISFISAIISNFIWNRYWTYPDSRSKSVKRQLSEFFIVNTIGVGIRTPIFAWLKDPLPNLFTDLPAWVPFDAEFLGYNMALAIAVGVVLFWNFFVNRYWTYADVEA